MKTLYVSIAAMLFFRLPAHGQDTAQLVTVQYADVPLEVILNDLESLYNLSFSYGHEQEALEERISIEAEDLPMNRFLSQLLKKAGLTYKVMGPYVVLRKTGDLDLEDETYSTNSDDTVRGGMDEDVVRLPLLDTSRLLINDIPDSVSRMEPLPLLPDSMIFLKPTMAVWRKARPIVRQRKRVLMVGPVFSMDYMRLKVSSSYGNNQNLHPALSYSIGGAFLWEISDRMAAEIRLLYSMRNFTIRYLVNTGGDPVGIPVKTRIALDYVAMPVSMNIRLLQYRRLGLYVGPGIFCNRLLKQQEETWLDDGRVFNTTTMHDQTLSVILWGVHGAVGFTYALSAKVYFLLSPAYQFTINNFKNGPQQIRHDELNIGAALRIRI